MGRTMLPERSIYSRRDRESQVENRSRRLSPRQRRVLEFRQQVERTIIDCYGLTQVAVMPAAAAKGHAANSRAAGGLDIVGGIAEHDHLAGSQSNLPQCRLDNVRRGLRAARIVG